MGTNELIGRYSLGICSEAEVSELERRLRADETLQDEFLREAETDAHLRQEAQLGFADQRWDLAGNPTRQRGTEAEVEIPDTRTPIPRSRFGFPSDAVPPSANIWKWVSGISTLAAAILIAMMILNFPRPPAAMAYPSLGQLRVEVSRTEHNIWAAAAYGDLKAVRKELEGGVSVNAKEATGLTPLHIAALFGQPEVAGLLLSSGADVSLANDKGNTALHLAAFLGRTDIVRMLLKSGADPAVRNDLWYNSVDNVAFQWNVELESYYREIEDELNQPLDLDWIKAQRPKILALLTSAVASGDSAPPVSIWQAVMVGNPAAVEKGIAAGSDLNLQDEIGGNSPLMLAAIYGRSDIARILIDAGADLEVRNKTGGTALHQACFFCRPEIVELLLRSGANSGATNNSGRSPRGTVTSELDAELIAIYKYVYDWLQLDFNLDHIKATRIQIAEILNEHERNWKGE